MPSKLLRKICPAKKSLLKKHVLPEDVCEEIFDVLALTDRNKTIELFKKYRNIRKVD